MEVDEDGVLAKIIKSADSGSIKVGELIAVVAEDGEDWKSVASSAATGTVEAPPASSEAPAASPVSTGGSTPGTVVNMPSLSPTMSEGTIVKWYKQEGEQIAAGDVLCDIQTDKAVVSMEADEDGVVAKILMAEGAAGVVVGTPIAVMVEEGQDWKDVAIPAASSTSPAASKSETAAAPPAPSPPVTAAAAAAVASSEFVHPAQTGPATALLLTQYGINPAQLEGSGPKGNLTKSDVLQYIKAKSLPTPAPPQVPLPGLARPDTTSSPPASLAQPPPGQDYEDIELSSMRKVIAKRLTESKQFSPHGYSSATADLTAVNRLRQEYIKSGFKVSINDFVISAVAGALQYVPQLNANVVNEEPVYSSNIDISVAVATPNGLITPIVKSANTKAVQEISQEVKELAGKAKENKLKLDEFQGGTFTISNLGMFGIAEFTAIINAPQLAILAVGGGRNIIDPETMRQTTVMTSTLSFDQRYVDDATAAEFMSVFRSLIEKPELQNRGFMSSIKPIRAAASV